MKSLSRPHQQPCQMPHLARRRQVVLIKATLMVLLMDKILHYFKYPKLWELWYIPYNGSCRILSINRSTMAPEPSDAFQDARHTVQDLQGVKLSVLGLRLGL